MKKIFLIHIILLCVSNLIGQVIYLSSTDNRLYRLNIVTCNYTQIVALGRSLTDISFHPDKTLYGINTNGNLFEIDTMNGTTNNVYQFNGAGQRFNSLTTSADGIIYSTGDDGALFSYNKTNNTGTYHGLIGYRATGDLTFYNGKLYAAAQNNRIILVDINNPPNSSVAVDGNILGKEIFGIVSYSASCDSINCYAITSGYSDIYEIDFVTKTLQLVCNLNIRVGGGASTYEFFSSAPIIFDQVISTDPSCSNNDGSFSIIVSGGIAPLTYSINGIDFQVSNTFGNLPGGTYQFIVSDANGCTIIDEVTLTTPTGSMVPLIENITMVPSTCGGSNGQLELTVNGGNGIILYSIDGTNFQTTPFFDNLSSGEYYITVKDSAGCMDMDSLEVTALSLDTIEKISASLVSCDVSTGTLIIDVDNASGIQYSIDGINFQSGNHFSQLSPGVYLVTIQDANGCRDTMSAVISPPVAVNIDQVQTTDPLCDKDEGSIVVTASGGTGQILYSIDDMHYQPENVFDHLAPSNYLITIQDKNGCIDTSDAVINPGVTPQITDVEIDSSHCLLNDGVIVVTGIGGNGQIQYSIDGVNFQNNNRFDQLAPLSYHVFIKDVNGCIDSTLAGINIINALAIGNIETDPPRCDLNDGSLEIISTGEIGQVQYSIDGINYQASNLFSNLGAGPYVIDIEDSAGCKARANASVAEPPGITIDRIETSSTACEETNGSIVIDVSGGTGLVTISFDGGAFETRTSFQQLAGGLHELTITDENGCLLDTLVKVARQRCKIYIPNSFSPNLDGVNDLFMLASSDEMNIQIIKYMIFDRWGNMVYSVGHFPIGSTQSWWDGTFKKMTMSPGVFAYYIEVQYEDGGHEIFKGDVTLVK